MLLRGAVSLVWAFALHMLRALGFPVASEVTARWDRKACLLPTVGNPASQQIIMWHLPGTYIPDHAAPCCEPSSHSSSSSFSFSKAI